MQGHNSFLDDEIDLRGLIRSLLKYKWWVLGITLAVALVAFVATQLNGAGKSYQAKALLVFGQPVWSLNNPVTAPISNATISVTSLPDSKGITDLATVDDLLYAVFQAPELAQSRSNGLTFGRLKAKLGASLSGTNQLLLQVKDPDPKQAALIANVWAQAVADRLNTLYGSSNAHIAALEEQTKDAQQAWESADKALVDYLLQSNVDGLTVQLTQAQLAYNSQLGKLHSIDLMLSDGRALSGRLAAQQATAALSTGDSFSILALEQRANEVLVCNSEAVPLTTLQTPPDTGVSPDVSGRTAISVTCSSSGGVQIQLGGSAPAGAPGTVADAQQELKRFLDSLQAQQTELKSSVGEADKQLGSLHSQLESAQFQVDKLTAQRDLAGTAYQTLLSESNSTRVEMAANGEVARIAGKALPPGKASSSRDLLYTAAAAALAFILCVIAVYLIEWWRAPGPSQP